MSELIKSPHLVLEAILDEVEGLRRTDPRSYLPWALLQRAREAVQPEGLAASGTAEHLRDADDMKGRNVRHVFDSGLKSGDMLILFSDGAFIVFDAEPDDGSAYITVNGGYGRTGKLADYLFPRDLLTAGLITQAEYDQIKREEAQKEADRARQRLERARAELAAAEKALGVQPAEAAK